jgi:hypothetical protein
MPLRAGKLREVLEPGFWRVDGLCHLGSNSVPLRRKCAIAPSRKRSANSSQLIGTRRAEGDDDPGRAELPEAPAAAAPYAFTEIVAGGTGCAGSRGVDTAGRPTPLQAQSPNSQSAGHERRVGGMSWGGG